MINSCLDQIFTIDEYDVVYEDFVMAKFRLLNQLDANKINAKRFGVFYESQKEVDIEIAYELSLVLTWWIFDKDITEENISNLKEKYLKLIIESYLKIKNEYELNYKSYEEQIKIYINLLEQDSKNKNATIKLMLSSESFYNNLCSNCKLNDVCKRKKELPKFLPFVQRVVKYAYSYVNQNPEKLYMNKGMEEQPLWFTRFLDYAISFIIETKNKKQENNLPNKHKGK